MRSNFPFAHSGRVAQSRQAVARGVFSAPSQDCSQLAVARARRQRSARIFAPTAWKPVPAPAGRRRRSPRTSFARRSVGIGLPLDHETARLQPVEIGRERHRLHAHPLRQHRLPAPRRPAPRRTSVRPSPGVRPRPASADAPVELGPHQARDVRDQKADRVGIEPCRGMSADLLEYSLLSGRHIGAVPFAGQGWVRAWRCACAARPPKSGMPLQPDFRTAESPQVPHVHPKRSILTVAPADPLDGSARPARFRPRSGTSRFRARVRRGSGGT
jgi:hypothetical protein